MSRCPAGDGVLAPWFMFVVLCDLFCPCSLPLRFWFCCQDVDFCGGTATATATATGGYVRSFRVVRARVQMWDGFDTPSGGDWLPSDVHSEGVASLPSPMLGGTSVELDFFFQLWRYCQRSRIVRVTTGPLACLLVGLHDTCPPVLICLRR